MADFGVELNLTPKIDSNQIQRLLQGQHYELPLEINQKTLQSSINSTLDTIHTHKIKLEIDRAYLASQVKQALSSVNVDIKDFGTQKQISKSSKSTSAAKDFALTEKQVKSYQNQIYRWQQSISRMENSGFFSGKANKEFRQQLTQVQQLTAGTKEWADAYDVLNEKYARAQEQSRNVAQQTKLQNQIDKKAATDAKRQAKDLQQVYRAESTLKRNQDQGYTNKYEADLAAQISDIKTLTYGTEQYSTAMQKLKDTQVKYNEAVRDSKLSGQIDTAQIREQEHLNNLYQQASKILRENSRVRGTSVQGKLETIMQKSMDGTGDYVTLSRDLAAARAEMEKLGISTETLGGRLKHLFGDHFNTAIAMAGLHALQNTMQSVLTNVIDIDTEMTDLKKVSNATASQYSSFFSDAADNAVNLGATITDVIGATSEFSRLGYDLDESSVLGQAAVKYLNVSEYTNIEEAAQSIVSTMQAFGIEAENVGDIVDKFNEVGNNYAISSQGLGEAMQRSAASLALAGNTLDESLALVTAANEVVQDPDVVGTWAKTLTMYLRAAKTEAEEAGVETEGMANSVSELRESVLKLTSGRVDIMQDDTTFKNTVQIMREIAGVYDEMTDVDQAALLELLSGKRQANTTAALISNWETVEAAIVSSQNAMGSADKENEKFLDSIQGKIEQFKGRFQELSAMLIDSDLVKGLVDGASTLLDILMQGIGKLGTIPGLLAPISAILASIGNVGIFRTKQNADGTTQMINIFQGLIESSKAFSAQLKTDQQVLKSYFSSGQNLTGNALSNAFKGASQNAIDFAQDINVVGLNSAQAAQKIEEYARSQQRANSISTKFVSTLKNIGVALLNMAAFTAISVGISALINLFDDLTLSASEAAEITENVTQEFTQTSSGLQSSISEVESLRERFDELSRGVSDNGKNISLTTAEYEEYQDIVSELIGLNPALVQAYNDEHQAIIDKNSAIEETINLLKQQQVEEAKNTVYGGRATNDGGLSNLDVAVKNMHDEYSKQLDVVDDVASDIADVIYEAYANAEAEGVEDEVQNLLENVVGKSVSDIKAYTEMYDTQGNKKQVAVQADIYDLIDQNQQKLAQNMPRLISELSDMGVMSVDAAKKAQKLTDEFNTQTDAIDSTASSFRTMIQALYESNEKYYNLSDESQAFLETFKMNIGADMLNSMDSTEISSLINGMIDSIVDNPTLAASIQNLYSTLAKKDSIPVGKLIRQGESISEAIAEGIDMEQADVYSILGFDSIQKDAEDIRNTVKSTFLDAFEGIGVSGISLAELTSNIDFDDLSLDQLATMNQILNDAGSQATEFAANMSMLASTGQLVPILDEVTKSISDQASEMQTVSDAISAYAESAEGLIDGVDTHENIVDIYDEFAKSVNKGQINTETARKQMELLIGKVVSLNEAKEWVKDNEGLFLTGTDEEKIGQDLTGIYNTLHKKYNEMSADQKQVVDSLMNVNWDTGSITVAEADVVKLADAFGISAVSMQQALDLISTYSDYITPSVGGMVGNIQALGTAVSTTFSDMDASVKDSTIAWDEMTVTQKHALQELTRNSDIDITGMTVSEVENLYSAYSNLQAKLGETPTAMGLISYLQDLKTASGEAAVEVSRLSDGSWSIDVTSLETFASSIGSTTEQAQILLGAIGALRDDSGNPITLTINGKPAMTETDDTSDIFDELVKKLETDYEIKVDSSDAQKNVNTLNDALKKLPEKKEIRITTTQTQNIIQKVQTTVGGVVSSLFGGGAYNGITGKMQSMASGGQSPGGKTLVGELGRELWISRDGKRKKIVGDKGMEVIRMHRGDAIVPNNLTEALIRGGLDSAWAGASSSNPLHNLNVATDGKYTNWTGSSSSSKKSSSSKSKSSSSSSAADELEDKLKELKEAFDDILNTFEHSIFVLEKNRGPVSEIVAIYRQMQDAVHQQAEKYRSMGVAEDSEYIQELQKNWLEYRDSIVDAIVGAYEDVRAEQENLIDLSEKWQTDAIAADNLPKVERYANDMIRAYKNLQDNLHDQAEYYRSLGYSDTSDEVSELSEMWWDYEQEIKNVKQAVIDNLKDMVQETSDALGDLQGVYDTLRDAANEYAENNGFISIDSYREIMELGPEYMQYLKDENGLLSINEERLNAVISAKAEQLALDNAMTYIERLRLAMQQGSIEDLNRLLGLTIESTDATWGFVYASLALLDLGSEQYQAALHNINAIRALANSAIAGVGKVNGSYTDELNKMKDGMDDLLQYVMDMLQHEVDEQINALEDLKTSYGELIDLKKESLQASKDETDYQDNVAEKVKEIAKLQQQINALSLDDSRDAQSQKAALEEQLAELQKELADTQADYAYNAQVDSLDKMQEAYEKQKDDEIKKLENSISSQQKLYDKAIAYIEAHWDTLYDELISWNTEYGSVLNSEISSAWESALAAAKKYGSYVAALGAIDSDISAAGSGDSGDASGTIIGSTDGDSSYGDKDMVVALVNQMYRNSQMWPGASESGKKQLDAANLKIASQLAQYGVRAVRDEASGVWYEGYIGGTKLYDKYLKYHEGGIVGGKGTLRQNEMIAVLENGEAVLDDDKQANLFGILDFATKMAEGFRAQNTNADLSAVFGGQLDRQMGKYAAAAQAPTEIVFGDISITGANEDTVKQHLEINRRFVNQILDILDVRK